MLTITARRQPLCSAACAFLLMILSASKITSADRCAEAIRDTRRAHALATAGQEARARGMLRAALLACPSNPKNLYQQAEVYDLLGDLVRAGNFRAQAMRVGNVKSAPAARFKSPSVTIERGQVATLAWATMYATEVYLGPEATRVPAHGSKTVAPTATTIYELKAKGPGGEATASMEVVVQVPRLTEASLIDLLKSEVPKARIAQLITERGIAFALTADVDKKLRAAGADDTVLKALEKAVH